MLFQKKWPCTQCNKGISLGEMLKNVYGNFCSKECSDKRIYEFRANERKKKK